MFLCEDYFDEKSKDEFESDYSTNGDLKKINIEDKSEIDIVQGEGFKTSILQF